MKTSRKTADYEALRVTHAGDRPQIDSLANWRALAKDIGTPAIREAIEDVVLRGVGATARATFSTALGMTVVENIGTVRMERA